MAFQGGPSSLGQQHQIDIAFLPRPPRDSTILTREIDLEDARDASNFASREKVDVVVLDNAASGNSKESITGKAEV